MPIYPNSWLITTNALPNPRAAMWICIAPSPDSFCPPMTGSPTPKGLLMVLCFLPVEDGYRSRP